MNYKNIFQLLTILVVSFFAVSNVYAEPQQAVIVVDESEKAITKKIFIKTLSV
ncbi:hypothetical protein [Brevibacillus brevis]|uniref:hypothetical protein n=1 Tax=Brevibacillus brevis TaxID=1393 RepID=UPI001902561B|nr:hypothetical protein [Brevibacillus brevis]